MFQVCKLVAPKCNMIINNIMCGWQAWSAYSIEVLPAYVNKIAADTVVWIILTKV